MKQINPVLYSLPRNDYDYEGGLTLYSVKDKLFYRIVFGTGDNLLHEDIEAGYDDYLMIDTYKVDEHTPLSRVFSQLNEYEIDDVDGVEEVYGSQLLVRRKDYETGDIRAYLADALDEIGYTCEDKEKMYHDLILARED